MIKNGITVEKKDDKINFLVAVKNMDAIIFTVSPLQKVNGSILRMIVL